MDNISPETVLEIIELESGEFAIRNADSNDEPMMKVEFSEELRAKLDDQYTDVARVMLTAGVQMIAESGCDLSDSDEMDNQEPEPTLH